MGREDREGRPLLSVLEEEQVEERVEERVEGLAEGLAEGMEEQAEVRALAERGTAKGAEGRRPLVALGVEGVEELEGVEDRRATSEPELGTVERAEGRRALAERDRRLEQRKVDAQLAFQILQRRLVQTSSAYSASDTWTSSLTALVFAGPRLEKRQLARLLRPLICLVRRLGEFLTMKTTFAADVRLRSYVSGFPLISTVTMTVYIDRKSVV